MLDNVKFSIKNSVNNKKNFKYMAALGIGVREKSNIIVYYTKFLKIIVSVSVISYDDTNIYKKYKLYEKSRPKKKKEKIIFIKIYFNNME